MLEKNERIIIDKGIEESSINIYLTDTTFNEDIGERKEDIYYCIDAVCVSCMETKQGYYLNISGLNTEIKKIWEHANDFGRKQLSKSTYSCKEIKISVDKDNQNFLIFGNKYTMFLSNYGNNFDTLTIVSGDYKDYNYILKDDVKMSLNNNVEEIFADDTYYTKDEINFLENAMALQNTPEWKIKNSDTSNKVDNNILEEISDAIKQGLNAEDVLVNVADMKISKGFEDAQAQLNSLIGLDSIKEEIERLEARLSYNKDMKSLGFYDKEAINLHMAFLGAPGTGKTTVARIITGMLSQYGYIKKNKCVEINGRQLVGSYVGQTGNKTAQIIRAAMGGVLFIDEAYSLVPADYGSNKDFSHEAIAQLLKSMEDLRGDLIVILAGYEKDMERLFNINEGMRSRINRNIYFKNYTALESAEIFLSYVRKDGLFVSQGALIQVLNLLNKCVYSPVFSNGRFVRNLYEKIIEEHSFNVRNTPAQSIEKVTILEEDISSEIVKDMR